MRAIATELEQHRFVIFHFDSDTRWSRRRDSENRQKFERQLRANVKLTLMTPRTSPKFVPLSEEDAEERVSRLFTSPSSARGRRTGDCVSDRFNDKLRQVWEARVSWHEFVELLRSNAALRRALGLDDEAPDV